MRVLACDGIHEGGLAVVGDAGCAPELVGGAAGRGVFVARRA
jgi:hypothetical protein